MFEIDDYRVFLKVTMTWLTDLFHGVAWVMQNRIISTNWHEKDSFWLYSSYQIKKPSLRFAFFFCSYWNTKPLDTLRPTMTRVLQRYKLYSTTAFDLLPSWKFPELSVKPVSKLITLCFLQDNHSWTTAKRKKRDKTFLSRNQLHWICFCCYCVQCVIT